MSRANTHEPAGGVTPCAPPVAPDEATGRGLPARPGPPPPTEVSQVVEHLFRHEAGKMVATLTKIFGLEHLTLAEDVVQEALARALQTWPFYGVPENPAAWIMRASRNLALDVVRRQKTFRDKEPEIVRLMDRESPAPDAAIFPGQEITDDTLRMMFVCCHPLIPAEARVVLALKTLCGFSVTEIARAFLTSEAAIAKRLTRAKQRIREARIPFEIPAGEELSRRLDGVLQSLYLLFNEGYKASGGDRLVREEVCSEAIRLTSLLAEHPAGHQPRTHALLALMLLNAARFPTRVDPDGNLLRLREQDRSRWLQPMVARGMFHLAQSAAGDEISEYHLQAGIAACHCAAPDYESTDWRQILSLYDRLVEFDDSPVVALNRAVALAEVNGPRAGIEAVNAIQNLQSLESYHLLHAVLGEFESRLNHARAAAGHFRKSLQLAEIKSEQAFLAKRIQDCEKKASGP
ncbi:MAG: sigma-70 family RNA polymerase sigma factor [Verrucomicrobiota bacterium]|nr:sigma-70 family RNA polymerase sigma factor [Verrucomicrobiota bacterium]